MIPPSFYKEQMMPPLFTISQGVEFTDISCGKSELGWSTCDDGVTSRCSGLNATVNCANDGRKFGSLTKKLKAHIIPNNL